MMIDEKADKFMQHQKLPHRQFGKDDDDDVDWRETEEAIGDEHNRLPQTAFEKFLRPNGLTVRIPCRINIRLLFALLGFQEQQNHQKPADEEESVDRVRCIADDLINKCSLRGFAFELKPKLLKSLQIVKCHNFAYSIFGYRE